MNAESKDQQPLVHLSEIGQIALTVRDRPRARDFYRNTLGMKFLFEAGTMVFFQCGSIRLMMGNSEKHTPNEGAILYFRVDDIQGAHAALKDRGVQIVQEPHLV
ncbi:MAG: VOC family protein, partial [Terracidiphilus sp.]